MREIWLQRSISVYFKENKVKLSYKGKLVFVLSTRKAIGNGKDCAKVESTCLVWEASYYYSCGNTRLLLPEVPCFQKMPGVRFLRGNSWIWSISSMLKNKPKTKPTPVWINLKWLRATRLQPLSQKMKLKPLSLTHKLHDSICTSSCLIVYFSLDIPQLLNTTLPTFFWLHLPLSWSPTFAHAVPQNVLPWLVSFVNNL